MNSNSQAQEPEVLMRQETSRQTYPVSFYDNDSTISEFVNPRNPNKQPNQVMIEDDNGIGSGEHSAYTESSTQPWLPGLRDYTIFQNAPPSLAKSAAPQVPPDDVVFSMDQNTETTTDSETKGPCHLVMVAVFILLYLIVLVGLPTLMITIGAIYFNQCPLNRAIPRWLIIFGISILLFNTHGVSVRCYERSRNDKNHEFRTKPLHHAIGFALIFSIFVIFIYGTAVIYSKIRNVNNSDPDSPRYCHAFPYHLMMISISIVYAISALSCLIFCIGSCVAGLIHNRQRNRNSTNADNLTDYV